MLFYDSASEALHIVGFETSIKSMFSCWSICKVLTSFCFSNAIPEDPIESIAYGQKVIFFLIFRPIAVGALLTTVIACVCVIIQALIDHRNNTTGYYDGKPTPVVYPAPSWIGVIKAFSTIMFAFAGASTFPTIQADMKHKHQFKYSAIIACTSKLFFLMTFPFNSTT